MTKLAVIVVALLVAAVVAFVSWWLSADQKARRAMRSVPLRRIKDVVEGEKARVIGEVEAERTVAAPLSGRPCTYWRVTVLEQRGGKNRHWVTVVDEHDGVDFFLRDGAAKALVKTELVQAVLDKDAKLSSGVLNDATPQLEAFLAERGHSTQGWIFNKTMRYHEGVVEPGERVCVVGVGRWERDPDEQARAGTGYRDAQMPKRLVLQSPDDGPLLLSDQADMTG